MKIHVRHDPLPIPIRILDYLAWSDDAEVSARAATAADAVETLVEHLNDEPGEVEVILY